MVHEGMVLHVSCGGAASGTLSLFELMLEGGVDTGETSGSALHGAQTSRILVSI